jgi:lipid-A-disaccharide synthase
MARVIDQVLALLPFEPPYMEAAGMACDFVGHPVVAEPQASPQDVAEFRAAFGLADDPYVLVLPGSRRGEVTRLAPVFGQALARLLRDRPDLRLVLPAAAPVAGLVREQVADWPVAPVILDPNQMDSATAQAHKRAAFAGATVALAASGTVSLELAAAGTPMVVAYTANWMSRQLMRHLLLIDTVTLVNLVSETRVVPECLGDNCKPDIIAARLAQVLADPGAQAGAMALTMQRLGQGGEAPGLRAARAVLDRL